MECRIPGGARKGEGERLLRESRRGWAENYIRSCPRQGFARRMGGRRRMKQRTSSRTTGVHSAQETARQALRLHAELRDRRALPELSLSKRTECEEAIRDAPRRVHQRAVGVARQADAHLVRCAGPRRQESQRERRPAHLRSEERRV